MVRRIRKLTATSTLALVLALCGVNAGSAGAVSKEFYGVISLEHPTDAEFTTMGRGQVGTLRILLHWPTVEPAAGQREWASYDRLFENAALNGIRVMPTIFGSPSYVAARPQDPPSVGARPAFAQFIADAVGRYGHGGTFWQQFAVEHPGALQMPIVNWQLWNEVSSPSFWTGKPSAKAYGKLLKLTATTIRTGDPAARVVLAGLFTKPTLRRAIGIEDYLNDLYKVSKIKKFFDAVAVHPYARTPKDALRAVVLVRKVLKENKDARTPIWITETGWASSGLRTRFTVSPAVQASHLARLFGTLTKKSKGLGIAGVIWYSLRDSAAGDDWLYRTGLFMSDGTAKPAWPSFVGFTGGTP